MKRSALTCLDRKKKSKSKSGVDVDAARERRRMEELLFEEHEATLKSDTPSGSGRNSPSISGGGTKKTEAERRFEETKKQRVRHLLPPIMPQMLICWSQLAQRVAKLAGMTHKDRVAEFNNHLESLSEHHDIPKVGSYIHRLAMNPHSKKSIRLDLGNVSSGLSWSFEYVCFGLDFGPPSLSVETAILFHILPSRLRNA